MKNHLPKLIIASATELTCKWNETSLANQISVTS